MLRLLDSLIKTWRHVLFVLFITLTVLRKQRKTSEMGLFFLEITQAMGIDLVAKGLIRGGPLKRLVNGCHGYGHLNTKLSKVVSINAFRSSDLGRGSFFLASGEAR